MKAGPRGGLLFLATLVVASLLAPYLAPFAADALDLAAQQLVIAVVGDPSGIGDDHLKLECRRTGVEHQNIHARTPSRSCVENDTGPLKCEGR